MWGHFQKSSCEDIFRNRHVRTFSDSWLGGTGRHGVHQGRAGERWLKVRRAHALSGHLCISRSWWVTVFQSAQRLAQEADHRDTVHDAKIDRNIWRQTHAYVGVQCVCVCVCVLVCVCLCVCVCVCVCVCGVLVLDEDTHTHTQSELRLFWMAHAQRERIWMGSHSVLFIQKVVKEAKIICKVRSNWDHESWGAMFPAQFCTIFLGKDDSQNFQSSRRNIYINTFSLLRSLSQQMDEKLPRYAKPLFVRFSNSLDLTGRKIIDHSWALSVFLIFSIIKNDFLHFLHSS